MGEITYRGNLSASSFPMVSNFQGRSVIINGPDQSYIRGLQVPKDGLINENDRGIPQIQYCHNVMPSGEGFQAVDFVQRVGAIGAPTDITTIIPYKETVSFGIDQFNYLTWSRAQNALYRLRQTAGVWNWAAVGGVGGWNNVSAMSSATVNGQCYLLRYFDGGFPCLTYNGAANITANAVLIGTATAFPGGLIKGNASCFGYHILWNETTIAWSSTINALDFTPSLITGAGFINVEGARGAIVAVVAHQLGLIVYTSSNAVACIFTGNKNFPFKFQEITGVGGFPDYRPDLNSASDLISDDSNTDSQFAYTSSGLQQVGINRINVILSDITDFISGQYMEDFDSNTLLFTRSNIGGQMQKKLNTSVDRYLIISYGIFSLTHAIVYDVINKRLGKLKIPHVCSFTLQNTQSDVPVGARGSVAFISNTGVVSTVSFLPNSATPVDSIIILGKFQHHRNRLIQLEQIDLENTPGVVSCYVYTSINGKNPIDGLDTIVPPVAATVKLTDTNLKSWSFHKTGMNHSIVFKGAFYASSFELVFHNNGVR